MRHMTRQATGSRTGSLFSFFGKRWVLVLIAAVLALSTGVAIGLLAFGNREIPKSAAIEMVVSEMNRLGGPVIGFGLFEIGGKSITIGKLVLAAVILFIGLRVARRLAAKARTLTLDQFHLEESVAAVLEKGLFYVLLVLVVLFSLSAVGIPLTVFAFLGGAVAIGVGFGSQNLVNNFISGLIMLFERPIKVGDVVEVDGVSGRVVDIGARCSHVRRFDGIDMLVPNSVFLEKKVINWTLSDRLVRFSFTVSVSYGASIRTVADLITGVLKQHEHVLDHPEPVVACEELGDTRIRFTANYWQRVTGTGDPRFTASELRYRVAEALAEAGVPPFHIATPVAGNETSLT